MCVTRHALSRNGRLPSDPGTGHFHHTQSDKFPVCCIALAGGEWRHRNLYAHNAHYLGFAASSLQPGSGLHLSTDTKFLQRFRRRYVVIPDAFRHPALDLSLARCWAPLEPKSQKFKGGFCPGLLLLYLFCASTVFELHWCRAPGSPALPRQPMQYVGSTSTLISKVPAWLPGFAASCSSNMLPMLPIAPAPGGNLVQNDVFRRHSLGNVGSLSNSAHTRPYSQGFGP
jgi:hypothetical protein